MSLAIDIAGNQIDGARDYQEDAFLITHLGDRNRGETTALVIVADGMGGHAAGNVASNMAVQAFNKHFTQHLADADIHQLLLDCIQQANTAIADTIRETSALQGMGCTLVAAFINNDQMWIASVGDSHLFLLRDETLEKHNADHSYGGFLDRMAAAGKPVEAEEGFARNMLMSALTGEDIADIDCPKQAFDLQAGDRIILASDGIDTLSHGKIIQFSNESTSAKSCSDALLEGVTQADMPRQDNTTVIIVDVFEEAEQGEQKTAKEADKPAPFALQETIEREQNRPSTLSTPSYKAESHTPPQRHSSSGGKGGMLAALLVVVIAAGIGAWFFLGQSSSPPVVVETEPLQESPEEQAGDMQEPENAESPEMAASESTAAEALETMPTPLLSAADAFADPLTSGGQGPLMMQLPAGSFMMGSPGHSDNFDERPQHQVDVPAFAISQHEITIAEYELFARRLGRKFDVPANTDKQKLPMVNVTWQDAVDYSRWLSEQTGQTYRLASEAEWEYAARAGTSSNYWWGMKIGKANAHCGFCGSSFEARQAAPVGSFTANPFGLYDTAGNVHEWVADCFHDSYENAPNDGSVWGGDTCELRIIRGGSFDSAPDSLRSAKRDKLPADRRYDHVGFRVVRE